MADAIKFRCKSCEKKISVRAEYAGKKVKCPGCSEPLRVPSQRPKRSKTGVPIGAGVDSDASSAGEKSYSLSDLAEMEANAETQIKELSSKATSRPSNIRIKGGKDCPSCGSSCQPDAVLCVHCGHSYESGKTLKTKKIKAKRERGGRRAAGDEKRPGVGARLLYLLFGLFRSR